MVTKVFPNTPAIQGHRVEGSKKFMIFKMLHFPSVTLLSKIREDLGDRREDLGDQREDIGD